MDTSDDTWTEFSYSDGLESFARAVHVDGNGGKWFHGGGGVTYLDDGGTPSVKSNDTFVTYTRADGMTETEVDSLGLDPAGGKWVGHIWTGVDWWNDNGTPLDKTDDTWVNFDVSDGLSDPLVQCITIEPGKGVWFGSWWGVDFLDYGASPLIKTDDQWVDFVYDGLTFPIVNCITIDLAGRKWIGTWWDMSLFDDGGTPFNKGDDQWLTYKIKQTKGFNEVRSIAIDQSGAKWMATTRSGVYYLDDAGTPFDTSDDSDYYSRKKNGLMDSAVRHILIDANNGKWVATRFGLDYLP